MITRAISIEKWAHDHIMVFFFKNLESPYLGNRFQQVARL
jgi:hypothetical protein